MPARLGSHLRTNVIGYLALFVALSGGAYAASVAKNSVRSKSIKDGQVKAADIGDGQVLSTDIGDGQVLSTDIGDGQVAGASLAGGSVTADKLGVGAFKRVDTAAFRSSMSYGDLGLSPGPSVSVTVRDVDRPVAIYAKVASTTGHGAVGVFDINAYGTFSHDLLDVPGTHEYTTASGSPGGVQITGPPVGGWVLLELGPVGEHTLKLVYKSADGTSTSFQNRTLWALAL